MASALRAAPVTALGSGGVPRRRSPPEPRGVRRCAAKPGEPEGAGAGSRPENAVLRAAWYGSELLGIAASLFRPPPPPPPPEAPQELDDTGDGDGFGLGTMSRARVIEAIKDDFERSYFVTGFEIRNWNSNFDCKI